jgi:predicted lipoprotein with Yx(FWY)xxD motif
MAASTLTLPAVLAACSSSPGTAASTTAATPTTTAPPTTSGPGAATTTTTAPGGVTPVYAVRTGTVPGLGKVLVDGQGFTLYVFEPDKQSGKSTCYGQCAQGWPPLLLPTGVPTPVAGPGVTDSLLGTAARTDGTTEVTYNRWPLYLWVNDSSPGQATGQGVNNLGGLWYVLAPDGRPILKRP